MDTKKIMPARCLILYLLTQSRCSIGESNKIIFTTNYEFSVDFQLDCILELNGDEELNNTNDWAPTQTFWVEIWSPGRFYFKIPQRTPTFQSWLRTADWTWVNFLPVPTAALSLSGMTCLFLKLRGAPSLHSRDKLNMQFLKVKLQASSFPLIPSKDLGLILYYAQLLSPTFCDPM